MCIRDRPWAVSVVLLFCDFKTSQTAAVILALVIYFIFESFNTFVAVSYTHLDVYKRQVLGVLEDIDPHYPKLPPEHAAELQECREALENE